MGIDIGVPSCRAMLMSSINDCLSLAYLVCGEQCDRRGISEEEFQDSLFGRTMNGTRVCDGVTEAVRRDLSEFFLAPNPKRKASRKKSPKVASGWKSHFTLQPEEPISGSDASLQFWNWVTEQAAIAQQDPWPLTLRQLVSASHARQLLESDKTARICAAQFNSNRTKDEPAVTPNQCNPLRDTQTGESLL